MMNSIKTARVHLVKFAFVLPLLAVLLLAFRKEREASREKDASLQSGRSPITGFQAANDTTPTEKLVLSKLNREGYLLSIADNNGECIVIIKDKTGKVVKAMQLTEWNQNKKVNTLIYGELPSAPPPPDAPGIPSPPSPPVPGEIAAQPSPGVQLAPVVAESPLTPIESPVSVHPAVPAAPAAPSLPANVRSIHITDNNVRVELKNGKTEKYDLNIPAERAAFEKKYGNIQAPQPPRPVKAIQLEQPVRSAQPAQSAVGSQVVAPEPVFFVDGRETARDEVNRISPSTIENVNVLKGEHATGKYGEKGKNGVMEIRLKKAADSGQPSRSSTFGLFNPFKPKGEENEKDKC